MPALPPIEQEIRFLLQQALMQGAQLNTMIAAMSKNMGNVSRASGAMSGQVTRGIGGFYVMRQALTASTNAMKAGVRQAEDMEMALTNLSIKTGTSGQVMGDFERIAQDVAASIGPLTAVDVAHNMSQLANTFGSTVPKMEKLVPLFSKFVSNAVELSEGHASVEVVRDLGVQVLNLFGGMQNLDRSSRVLERFHGTLEAFAARDPARFVSILKPMTRSLTGKGISDESIMDLAAFSYMMPQTTKGGRDIRAFVEQAVTASMAVKRHGAASREQAGAMEALGFTQGGRPSIFDPATGQSDVGRLLSNMDTHVQSILRGPHGIETLNTLFVQAFRQQLPRGIAQALTQEPGVLGKIAERVGHMPSIDETLKRLQGTTKVSLDQLSTNVLMLGGELMKQPSAALGGMARLGAGAAGGMMDLSRNVPGFGLGLGAAFLGGTGGMAAVIGGLMLRGVAGWAGTSGAGMVGGRIIAGLAAGMTGAGEAAIIAAALGAVLAGGIAIMEQSSWGKRVVDEWAAAINEFFSQAMEMVKSKGLMNKLTGLLEFTPPGIVAAQIYRGLHPETPELVGPTKTMPAGGAAPAPSPHAAARSHVMTRMTVQGFIGQIVQNLRTEMDGQTGGGATPGSARMYGIGDVPGVGAVVR